MELISLPSPYNSAGKRRIELWRRAIFLFDKTEKEEGPFHSAGYKDYWCEGKSEEKLTPDVFGFSDGYFCVCDISMSSQKGEEMSKYKKCSPSEYMKALFPSEEERKSAGYPFLITDEFQVGKNPGYNLLQVYQPGEAFIERIDDENLKQKLDNWMGFITSPPSYGLLAVPESTFDELKSPLSTILKWAVLQPGWVTFDEIIQKLLGNLYKSFSQKGISILRKNIVEHIRGLSKGILKGYIALDIYQNRFKIDLDGSSHQSRKAFSTKISEWLDMKPIEYFVPIDEEEEDDSDED
jgi:hypothetical protein